MTTAKEITKENYTLSSTETKLMKEKLASDSLQDKNNLKIMLTILKKSLKGKDKKINF